MLRHKIITDFGSLKDWELNMKAQHIISYMSGNIHFSNTVPSLTSIKIAKAAYQIALAKIPSDEWEDMEEKKHARKKLEDLLTLLGHFVQLFSNQNIAIMQSSSFEIIEESDSANL